MKLRLTGWCAMEIKAVVKTLSIGLVSLSLFMPIAAQNNATSACAPEEMAQVRTAATDLGLEELASLTIAQPMADQALRTTAFEAWTSWQMVREELPRCSFAEAMGAQVEVFLLYVQLAPTYSQLGMFSESAEITRLGTAAAETIIENIFATAVFGSDHERIESGAAFGDELSERIVNINGVIDVGIASVLAVGDGTYIIAIEARTEQGSENLETASEMFDAAAELVTISDFYSILDDCDGGAVDFGWSVLNPEWRITPLSISACG